MNSSLLIGIVTILKNHDVTVSDILSELVDKFIECGIEIDELEDCYGIYGELDLILDEVCSLKSDESDFDDIWPDGGREDF